jgi:hypothetical protein
MGLDFPPSLTFPLIRVYCLDLVYWSLALLTKFDSLSPSIFNRYFLVRCGWRPERLLGSTGNSRRAGERRQEWSWTPAHAEFLLLTNRRDLRYQNPHVVQGVPCKPNTWIFPFPTHYRTVMCLVVLSVSLNESKRVSFQKIGEFLLKRRMWVEKIRCNWRI